MAKGSVGILSTGSSNNRDTSSLWSLSSLFPDPTCQGIVGPHVWNDTKVVRLTRIIAININPSDTPIATFVWITEIAGASISNKSSHATIIPCSSLKHAKKSPSPLSSVIFTALRYPTNRNTTIINTRFCQPFYAHVRVICDTGLTTLQMILKYLQSGIAIWGINCPLKTPCLILEGTAANLAQ